MDATSRMFYEFAAITSVLSNPIVILIAGIRLAGVNKMKSTNIFEVLALSRAEDPHDRMLAWLCDPSEGHGLINFAATLIHSLWDHPFDESVILVKRQYQLGPDSWPDVVVKFESSLLVVENKVNASALREGQLERQNTLAREKQAGKPLFHVLLCPDRFRVDDFGPEGSDFRTLTYSHLARLVREASENANNASTSGMLRDYASYIENAFGERAITGLRIASAKSIARRNNDNVGWSEEQFLQQACRESPNVADAQRELVELLRSMECVEPRFDSIGSTNATYKVYLSGTEYHPLWVYSDGRLYVNWGLANPMVGSSVVSACKSTWQGLVNSSNKGGSFVKGGLAAIGAVEAANKLQELSDAISVTSSANATL